MTREEIETIKGKAVHDAICSIENRVRHVYNQGFEEGKNYYIQKYGNAYNKGLEDAWECARKIISDTCYGGYDAKTLKQIFGTPVIPDVFKNSASEAVVKLKEYEEQQKQSEKSCKDCKHGINGMLNFKSGRCEACYYDERLGGNCLFEEKQTEEKTERSCESCRFAELQPHEFPCCTCSQAYMSRWEPQKGTEE